MLNKGVNEYMIGGKTQLDLDENRLFTNGGYIVRDQTLFKCMVGTYLFFMNSHNTSNITPRLIEMRAG